MISICKNIVILLIATSLSCCAQSKNITVPQELWENLNPLSKNFEDGLELLPEYLAEKKNRETVIKFAHTKLSISNLSFLEQIKIGALVRGLQEKSEPDEYKKVCALISKGKNYPDYYNLALSPYPPYFLESIKVFKNSDEMYGKFYGHDGSIHKFNIKDGLARRLLKATGKNYGRSYQDWTNWWNQTGQYLEFDYVAGKYKES